MWDLVIHSQGGWGVTYTSTGVCAGKGSSVKMFSSYTHPSRIKSSDIKDTFWFTKEKDGEPVDLRSDPQYSDPGLQVEVSSSGPNKVDLKCLSSDDLPYGSSYIWYKNEQKINRESSSSLSVSFVSPSGEIVEGSSVNLTCSSNANPAANYTWYKRDGNLKLLSEGPQLVFSSIQSSDSGHFYCEAENQLGRKRSKFIFIDVKYAPKLPSVSVSPSGEIVEGSSVNLTCSSDANPAASYTWYKEDEDSPKASGHIFTITDFRDEHSGNYSCEAQNTRGRSNSTLHLSVAAVVDTTTMILHNFRWTLLAVGPISLLLLCLWMRKKKALISTSEPHEPKEAVELDVFPVYDNISDTAAQPEDTEEQESQM
ncbi:limbic system-associated membrane protein-like [Clinocottus analis]|uniref:limbic system-associated membrane protein-like n=1 Tax=Clinocottus analis TaxID=304258 RepID=UPI0035C020A8